MPKNAFAWHHDVVIVMGEITNGQSWSHTRALRLQPSQDSQPTIQRGRSHTAAQDTYSHSCGHSSAQAHQP